MVTWRQSIDFLRCNPRFHGKARDDGVILDEAPGQVLFGILRAVFLVDLPHIAEKPQPFILVSTLKPVANARLQRSDKKLGLYRLRQQHTEFFHANSIIRGCFLVPDFDDHGVFYAGDTVDTDMFLRLRSILGEDDD